MSDSILLVEVVETLPIRRTPGLAIAKGAAHAVWPRTRNQPAFVVDPQAYNLKVIVPEVPDKILKLGKL